MHIPKSIRRLYERRGGITILSLIVAGVLTETFDLGWRRLEILGFVALVAIIIELWIDSALDDQKTSQLEAEVNSERARAETAEEAANRIPELESSNLDLEIELDGLRKQLASPRLSLEEILGTLDSQLSLLALVGKHRQLREDGLEQWPVTSLQLNDEGVVRVTAHADAAAERVSGEGVALMHRTAGAPLAFMTIETAFDHNIVAAIDFSQLPEFLQDELLDRSLITPAGMVLRLFGLVAQPYDSLSNDDMSQLETTLLSTARSISQLLTPSPQLELEEGQTE